MQSTDVMLDVRLVESVRLCGTVLGYVNSISLLTLCIHDDMDNTIIYPT